MHENKYIGEIKKQGINLYAHRGASFIKENSLDLLTGAHTRGYCGFEADLRLTKDNKVVVIHDADLWRLFGVKCAIYSCTLAELRQHANRVDLPTLNDLLEYFEINADIKACLELRSNGTKLAKIVANEVIERGLTDRIRILGFKENLKAIPELKEDDRYKGIEFGVILRLPYKMEEQLKAVGATYAHIGWSMKRHHQILFKIFVKIFKVKDQIKELKSKGFGVAVGCPVSNSEMSYLLDLKPNDIISNEIIS